jgi:hypothetical protein
MSDLNEKIAKLQDRADVLAALIGDHETGVREGMGDEPVLSTEQLHALADEFEGKAPRRLISDGDGVRFARPA